MWLVGLSYFVIAFHPSDGASDGNAKILNMRSAIAVATLRETDPVANIVDPSQTAQLRTHRWPGSGSAY
jgi:hypothetical protein